MSTHCCHDPACSAPAGDGRLRKALWIALVLNAVMFVVELGASWSSGSVSLMADSIDFAGDAGNYAISLFVLGMATSVRAKASLFKAGCMALFGVFVLSRAVWTLRTGQPPEAVTMGAVGGAALAVNAGVALMLFRFRSGDSNMRSVWICSRNDAIGNIAVMAAALGVFGTGSAWPDLLVAVAMAALALTGAASVIRQARTELTPSQHDASVPSLVGDLPGGCAATTVALGGCRDDVHARRRCQERPLRPSRTPSQCGTARLGREPRQVASAGNGPGLFAVPPGWSADRLD